MSVSAEWSARDADGIQTLTIGFAARASLHGQRFRRKEPPEVEALQVWPDDWRELLAEWLKAQSERTRWSTLLKLAGPRRVIVAHDLLAALLRAGFLEVDERRDGARWVTVWVRFLKSDVLRNFVGLPDARALAEDLDRLKSHAVTAAALAPAYADAARNTTPIAIRRLRLLHRLDEWMKDQRRGTRRDFALFATGETKGVAESDWGWLDSLLDLDGLGVERHVPLLLLRAPLVLRGARPVDLHGIPDCVGLSPLFIKSVRAIEGKINVWRLVENRTLFDRVARQYGGEDGVVWIPGYPPEWWRTAVEQLMSRLPAYARIACDPDPAGMQIALQIGQLCDRIGVNWVDWGMDVVALESLPAYQSITTEDIELLRQLLDKGLPSTLAASARWMWEHGLKGEQEGLSDSVLRSGNYLNEPSGN